MVLGWCEERRQQDATELQVTVRCDDSEPLEVSIPKPSDENSLAHTLWPSSLAAAILLKSPASERLIKNKHVLELGCGLGLAGIVTSSSAKSCCLTDHDEEIIQILKNHNIPNIDARYLEWRDEDRPSDIPPSELVIGADIAYYFYLLRPLMDTTKAMLRQDNSAFMVVGQANRESQWDLYHNIRDGCYNQLTDEREASWDGETRMFLYQLQMFKWEVDDDPSPKKQELDGTIPIAVMLHTSPGLEGFAFTAFDHIATKNDEEGMMMSF
jgi:predicted nicotinamide N-methyase